jgi:hypothetical protein
MTPSLSHVLIALGIQLLVGGFYGVLGAGDMTPWIGATAASLWFVSRELSQSFRFSNPTKVTLDGWHSIREAGWPILVTHLVALVLTVVNYA